MPTEVLSAAQHGLELADSALCTWQHGIEQVVCELPEAVDVKETPKSTSAIARNNLIDAFRRCRIERIDCNANSKYSFHK